MYIDLPRNSPSYVVVRFNLNDRGGLSSVHYKDYKQNTGIINTIEDLHILFNKYNVIVGYNINDYINELRKHLKIDNNIIDQRQIIIKHLPIIKQLKGIRETSLSNITNHLGLFDTTEYGLYKWMLDFFEPFKYGLEEHDIENMNYMIMNSSVYTYKVLCNKTNLPFVFDRYAKSKGSVKGGYVMKPTKEVIESDVVEIDLSSAYPLSIIQNNLYSNGCECCETNKSKFELEQVYCSKERGVVEKTIEEIFIDRHKYKTIGDNKEFALKIILNTIYGIIANPIFKSVYDHKRANDCTRTVRTIIKHIIKNLTDKGYEVVYCDTDGVYVKLNHKTKEELMSDTTMLIMELKTKFSYPSEHFGFKIDNHFRLLYYPKLNKKNFIGVTKSNEVVIKGLAFNKKNSMLMSEYIFEKYIKTPLINSNIYKLNSEQLKTLIENEVKNRPDLVCRYFHIKRSDYDDETNSLQKQILQRYGEGHHKLIPNYKYGVGSDIKYCDYKEFIDNRLDLNDLSLKQLYRELEIFSDNPMMERRSFKGKRVINTLTEWVK